MGCVLVSGCVFGVCMCVYLKIGADVCSAEFPDMVPMLLVWRAKVSSVPIEDTGHQITAKQWCCELTVCGLTCVSFHKNLENQQMTASS